MISTFFKEDPDTPPWEEVDSRADWLANGGDDSENKSGYKSFYDHGREGEIVNNIGSTSGTSIEATHQWYGDKPADEDF